MRVLVACEFSGIVRDAFQAAGHDATSCDFLKTESRGPHIVGNVLDYLEDGWDLMIAHPPCTYLANSGVRWLYKSGRRRDPDRWRAMRNGAEFFALLLEAPHIPRIAVENPIIHKHAAEIIGRRQDQTVQPWEFGHPESKAICLWLKNLPPLLPTEVMEQREGRVWKESPGPDRWKRRSRFYPGIAKAMAEQWGALLQEESE